MESEDRPTGANGRTPAVPLEELPLHSTNLITVLDETGTVRYESPSITRIFGFEEDTLVGEPVAEYFHPTDRGRVVEAFRAVVESDEELVRSVEYRHQQADGSYVWVESVASATPMPDGSYVVNTRDISARKDREAELEDSNARLDEFASVVSHDLKNPLNVAQGRLQLAREEYESDQLDAVARAHDRMESLIDDLLTFAKSGLPIQKLEWVDLATVSRDCWETVATDDARLAVEIDRSVRADASRVRQLLENLIGNAVIHGGDAVTVRIGRLSDERGFYVADDGPGIGDAASDRVFDSGYSTREGGTGFGLKIVTEIVEVHGWEIELAESHAGGARFEITGIEFE